jgi:hypothetical protein
METYPVLPSRSSAIISRASNRALTYTAGEDGNVIVIVIVGDGDIRVESAQRRSRP